MKKKKLFIIILLIVATLVSSAALYIKYRDKINNRIASDLKIKIPYSLEIDYQDSHGWFGEGAILAKAKLTPEEIAAMVESSDEWREMPLAGNISKIVKEDLIDLRSGFGLEEFSDVYKIENGYWMLLDRKDQKRNYIDGEELELLGDYNISMAVIDLDTKTFYYIQEDF